MFPQTYILCSVRFPVLQSTDRKIAFIEEEEAAYGKGAGEKEDQAALVTKLNPGLHKKRALVFARPNRHNHVILT